MLDLRFQIETIKVIHPNVFLRSYILIKILLNFYVYLFDALKKMNQKASLICMTRSFNSTFKLVHSVLMRMLK